jgi:hypothetical protein
MVLGDGNQTLACDRHQETDRHASGELGPGHAQSLPTTPCRQTGGNERAGSKGTSARAEEGGHLFHHDPYGEVGRTPCDVHNP